MLLNLRCGSALTYPCSKYVNPSCFEPKVASIQRNKFLGFALRGRSPGRL